MPIKLLPKCPVCSEDKIFFDAGETASCHLCGVRFEAYDTCQNGHYVCPMCRQKNTRQAIIAHCLKSPQRQPLPLVLELMELPEVAMHGPEHHLLLAAALLTAYAHEKNKTEDLPKLLDEANVRSLGVPGGACGAWGICGAAVSSGIYMSILTEASPYSEDEWKITGQLTARCGHVISREGGPRCCKRDTFLSLIEATAYSNAVLDTHFDVPDSIVCAFYPNNRECKRTACAFFPVRARE
jgi:hypothetical protein